MCEYIHKIKDSLEAQINENTINIEIVEQTQYKEPIPVLGILRLSPWSLQPIWARWQDLISNNEI